MKIRAAVLYATALVPAVTDSSITTSASRPYADSRPLKIETVDLAPPGPDEVLVEIRAAGLCHSDLSSIEGVRKRGLPTSTGHEAAGIVREIGGNVSQISVGTSSRPAAAASAVIRGDRTSARRTGAPEIPERCSPGKGV